MSSGPLAGIRVIELPNLGPIQFAGMMLSDLGADVLVIDPPAPRDIVDAARVSRDAVLDRGRRRITIDLKTPDGVDDLLARCEGADVFIEGYRPGVAERLGVGPDVCRERNPRLVYGRMTGWGRDGPMRDEPGHDLNYIALAGALFHLGNAGEPPTPPLNLLADFGGGGMLLVAGVLAALVERATSDEGQVVDAAMVDGVALLMSVFWGLNANGYWTDERGTNLLDGGAHFYSVYETADGEWVSVAAFESKFYVELLRVLRLDDVDPTKQMDRSLWPAMKERLAALFRTRTRDEWVATFAGRETCFAPVLRMREAHTHPHHVARGVFVEVDGAPQPAPAPRFSRTPTTLG